MCRATFLQVMVVCGLSSAFASAQPAAPAPTVEELEARVRALEEEAALLRREVARLKLAVAEARAAREAEASRPAPAPAPRSRRSEPERAAAGILRQVVTHESVWRTQTLDGNDEVDYWTRDLAAFHCLHGRDGRPIDFIERDVARADAAPARDYPEVAGAKQPWHGYWFIAMQKDQDGEPYVPEDAPPPTAPNAPEGPSTNVSRFGFCAYPAEYGEGTKLTFVVNEDGVVWQKDTEGKPALDRSQAAPPGADDTWRQFDD